MFTGQQLRTAAVNITCVFSRGEVAVTVGLGLGRGWAPFRSSFDVRTPVGVLVAGVVRLLLYGHPLGILWGGRAREMKALHCKGICRAQLRWTEPEIVNRLAKCSFSHRNYTSG